MTKAYDLILLIGFSLFPIACILHGLDKWQSYKVTKSLEKRLGDLLNAVEKGELKDHITFNVEKIIKEQ